MIRRLTAIGFCWMALAGCSIDSGSTACNGLVYKEAGLTRQEYSPCAGEMIAALDQAETHLAAYYQGDKSARGNARAALRHFQSLWERAGGRKLLERWNDESLSSLNVDMYNAFTGYEAALALDSNADFNSGRQSHASAKAAYGMLH